MVDFRRAEADAGGVEGCVGAAEDADPAGGGVAEG